MVMERLYFENVCSSVDHVVDHIERHKLEVDPSEYLHIANSALSLGVDMGNGILLTEHRGRVWRVVLKGVVELDRNYHIVRSVLDKGPIREDPPFPGYWIKVKVPKVKTFIKPNLPEWSMETISDAIQKISDLEDEIRGISFRYCIPHDHIVSVRKKQRTIFR